MGASSEAIGNIAYRCASGNRIYDPCWRDGASQTEFVVCATGPWAGVVYRFRVPGLLLKVGVTWGRNAASYPWGVELANGDQCILLQGAHDSTQPGGKGLIVDYSCRSGIVLLRNLRRGGAWTIGSARYEGGQYTLLGDVSIRRASFGGLPPTMSRQNGLARSAVTVARRVIRQSSSFRRLGGKIDYPQWVRMTLADGEWARVAFQELIRVQGKYQLRVWDAVLHRVGGKWSEAKAFEPYCSKLPQNVKQQVLDSDECAGD